jgi:hypothetical protein
MSPKTAKSVAAILEQELDSMISEWKRQISLVRSLTNILLSDADRTGHLPALFDEVLCRLRGNRNTEPPVSIAAAAHGRLREYWRSPHLGHYSVIRANWIEIRCCWTWGLLRTKRIGNSKKR